MEKEEFLSVIESLQHTLKVAVDRVVYNGDRLVKLGESDVNRAIFSIGGAHESKGREGY